MRSKKKCAIVVRIDQDVVDAIDGMRDLLRMTRTQWIRKAIARNLEQNRQELPLIDRPEIREVLLP